MKKIRVCTLFSGYDSQCMALDRLKEQHPEFDYELVAWAEIDKFAIQAHNAVYPQWADRNYGDVSKIDWSKVPDFDLLTYSSPCQDFSNAGKQKGGVEGSGTRSSLLWECRRAILAKKPKYLLMENVAALVSQKFIGTFNQWQLELERYGYTNFSQVLNAKDYGVPQNRERIFMVSILDCEQAYYFPTPVELTIRLKDVLEKNVDERYYLKDNALVNFLEFKNFISRGEQNDSYNRVWKTDGYCGSLNCTKEMEILEPIIGALRGRNPENPSERGRSNGKYKQRLELNENHTSNTITSVQKDNVVVEPTIVQRGHGFNSGGEFTETAPTITGPTWHFNNILHESYRIRKLTERECFRLMGVIDTDSDKIRDAVSKSQCYKLAGNSIVVDVMVGIFEQLLIGNKNTNQQLEIF